MSSSRESHAEWHERSGVVVAESQELCAKQNQYLAELAILLHSQ